MLKLYLFIKYIFPLLLCWGAALTGCCQDKNYIQRPSLGVHLLLNGFKYSDSLHSPGKFNNIKAGIALNFLKGFTPLADLNATLAGSFISFPGKYNGKGGKHLLLEGDVSFRQKLFPGARRMNPFFQAGVGFSRFLDYYGLFLPAGVGLQVTLPGETFLLFNYQYRVPLTTTQLNHFYYSLGIAGIIGKKKNRKTRKIPFPVTSPTGIQAPAKDTDGDGIIDSLDACPNVPGLGIFAGCPDTDGDGIPDKDDKCPTLFGVIRYQGCPAPDSPGIAKNLRKRIEWAAKNVFFATDSFTLLPASFRALDEVADILKKNPALHLYIEGHTDNSGSTDKNQHLSEQRAKAVLEYLASRSGIERSRLSATGYGVTRPIADNTTLAGRALNRRVEFILKYY